VWYNAGVKLIQLAASGRWSVIDFILLWFDFFFAGTIYMIVILANLEMRRDILNHPSVPFQDFAKALRNPKGENITHPHLPHSNLGSIQMTNLAL
jgi:hypothetical protein